MLGSACVFVCVCIYVGQYMYIGLLCGTWSLTMYPPPHMTCILLLCIGLLCGGDGGAGELNYCGNGHHRATHTLLALLARVCQRGKVYMSVYR